MTDGGDLRDQYEALLVENKALKGQVQEYVVREVSGEFSLVKPEDLTGFETADEARAGGKLLQETRTEEQTTLLKAAGLTDEKIEAVLAGGTINEDGELDPNVAALSKQQSTNATRPPRVDTKQARGPAAIKAHFREDSGSDK